MVMARLESPKSSFKQKLERGYNALGQLLGQILLPNSAFKNLFVFDGQSNQKDAGYGFHGSFYDFLVSMGLAPTWMKNNEPADEHTFPKTPSDLPITSEGPTVLEQTPTKVQEWLANKVH